MSKALWLLVEVVGLLWCAFRAALWCLGCLLAFQLEAARELFGLLMILEIALLGLALARALSIYGLLRRRNGL